MQSELIVIDDTKGLEDLEAYLQDKEYVAYDCETTGLTKSHEVIGFSVCAEETKASYVILARWSKESNKLIYVPNIADLVRRVLNLLSTKKLVMHNGIFDCMMAESVFKTRLIDSLHTDTMLLAHLLDENRRMGLKELSAHYFGDNSTLEAKLMKASVAENGGLLTKADYQMYKADSQLLAKYGAKDALLTYKLFMTLVPELYEQGLDKFFYEEESMPLLKGPTYELNTIGLTVDTTALTQLKKTLEAECLEAKDFIHKEIQVHIKDKYPGSKKSNTFNIGSSGQLSWLLFGQLGLEFGTLTKGGKNIARQLNVKVYTPSGKRSFIQECLDRVGQVYELESIVNGKKKSAKKYREPWSYIACDRKTLSKLAERHKWVAKLLEYQKKTKLLTTYIKGIETRLQYGIIRPSFLQTGTTSGRYSSRNPNWQNLPRDDKRIKNCIVARPGKVFVGADYSQLEPRVFAYTSQDEKLKAAFRDGSDFYSVAGIEVYDKLECVPLKDGHPLAFGKLYPNLRQDAKQFILASTYGATGFQLAPLMGKSIEDAQKDIDDYLEKFPLVKKMMLDSHKTAKETGQVTNLFGRPRRIPDALKLQKIYGNDKHSELPYDARKLLNLAVNHRIQSTAASIVNRAMIRLYENLKKANIVAPIVCQVHDSLILECETQHADNVSILLQSAMETTTILEGVPLEAAPKIGKSFGEV